MINITEINDQRDKVILGDKARREYKNLLKDTFQCHKRLCTYLRDAQVEIWKGNYSEATIADLMKTSEVVSSETIYVGSNLTFSRTLPKKITLKCGIKAIFKRESKAGFWGSYKAEIACYQLDKKLLGLKMVPLTVEREIDGEKGSLQLWVPNMSQASAYALWYKPHQLSHDALFFNLLTGNNDRTVKNFGFIHNDPEKVVLFDNAGAFSGRKIALDRYLSPPKPTESLLNKAREITMDQLDQIEHLSKEQKEEFLIHRNILIGAIEKDNAAIKEGLGKLLEYLEKSLDKNPQEVNHLIKEMKKINLLIV